jgi:hypothetical protein
VVAMAESGGVPSLSVIAGGQEASREGGGGESVALRRG